MRDCKYVIFNLLCTVTAWKALMDMFFIPCASFTSHLKYGNCSFKPCLCVNLCVNFLIFLNFKLECKCKQYLKYNIIIMDVRL